MIQEQQQEQEQGQGSSSSSSSRSRIRSRSRRMNEVLTLLPLLPSSFFLLLLFFPNLHIKRKCQPLVPRSPNSPTPSYSVSQVSRSESPPNPCFLPLEFPPKSFVLQENDENLRVCYDYAISQFRHHQYLDVNEKQVARLIAGQVSWSFSLFKKPSIHPLTFSPFLSLSLSWAAMISPIGCVLFPSSSSL